MFPALAFEFGGGAVFLGGAEAEVADEAPFLGDFEGCGDGGRVEDGDPAEAEAVGAGGEPDGVDGHHGGVVGGFGHGGAAEAGAFFGGAVGEDGEVAGGFIEAGEFEAGVEGGATGGLAGEGSGVAGFEAGADCGAAGGVVDEDEAPGLAETDGGGEGCEG